MGVIEVLRRQDREAAIEQKSYDVVQNLISGFGFTDEQAAKVAEVPVSFVRKVRRDLAKKQK